MKALICPECGLELHKISDLVDFRPMGILGLAGHCPRCDHVILANELWAVTHVIDNRRKVEKQGRVTD